MSGDPIRFILAPLSLFISSAGAEPTRDVMGPAKDPDRAAEAVDSVPRGFDYTACGKMERNGPLTCEATYLSKLPPSSFSRTPPLLSPDGRSVAAYDFVEGLWLTEVAETAKVHIAGRYGIAGLGLAYDAVTFAWHAGGRKLFALRRTTDSHGFATSSLETVLFGLDGKIRPLPTLVHEAGPLDGIAWVGNAGMAIAEFGAKGEFHRPPREDPAPTLAIVDAMHGRVLQAIPYPPVDERGFLPRVMKFAVRQAADGGVHAALRLGNIGWFEWRQGHPLRPIVLGGERDSVAHVAITPDGSSLLIARALSASGFICEHNPNCPPPTPQTGVVAELQSLASGEVLWRLTGTATTFSNPDPPAISPSGRYALITLPRKAFTAGASTALISMEDGHILQTVTNPWSSECAMGFTRDGRRAWVSGGGNIYVFRLKP
jgi:hypothetical protein